MLAAMRNKAVWQKHGNQIILALGLFLMLAIQFRFVHAGLFWDDAELFKNNVIKVDSAPLSFWTRGHSETKSWPLFYTLMWGLIKIFGYSFSVYHLINIVIHAVNGWMIYRVGQRIKLRWFGIPALVFLIHPIVIEPVSWIFELSKLLSLFFLLLWFFYGSRADKPSWRFFYLVGAILTGGYAYLIALTEIFRGGLLRGLILTAVTLYFLFLVIAGTNLFDLVDSSSDVYSKMYAPVLNCEIQGERTPVAGNHLRNVIIYLKETGGLNSPNVKSTLCNWSMRFAAAGNSAFAFLKRAAIPKNIKIPQPFFTPGMWGFTFFLLLGVGIGCAAIFTFNRDLLTNTVLLTYLPISGFFFFGWLRTSLFADRLLYVPLAFLVLYLSKQFEPRLLGKRWIPYVLALWFGFLIFESHVRANYILKIYAMPYRSIQFTPDP
jgi:hypothetical protein